MKIIRLSASNIKRLTAVEITPQGALITIGGKNGAGKTSVLDSISYALGGEKLVPSDPIRQGERHASVEVDLGDLLIIRKFTREKKSDGTWDVTRSSLSVMNKDGARFPSPQAVIDKLLGKLTFDPLEFARAKPKDRFEVLRRLVGLDLTEVDLRRQIAASKRKQEKDLFETKRAQLQGMKEYPIGVEEEVSTSEIAKEMAQAEALRRRAQDLQHEAIRISDSITNTTNSIASVYNRIEELAKSIEAAQASVKTLEAKQKEQKEAEAAKIKEAEETAAKIPNMTDIQARLSEAEEVNAKVRANQARKQFKDEVDGIEVRVKEFDSQVKEIDKKRNEMLVTAANEVSRMTVPGLGLNDEGVLFNGFPFEQASTSEQLRCSVAMGLALNPKLKILLIRNGNALDDDSMKLVAEQAEKASAQIWVEYVTDSAEGMQVMIEDGHLAVEPEPTPDVPENAELRLTLGNE